MGKAVKAELLNCGDLHGYVGVLLEPLESLFEIAIDEESEAFHIAKAGMVLLKNIQENLENLGDLLESKFGNMDIMVKQGDSLKRPIKIEV